MLQRGNSALDRMEFPVLRIIPGSGASGQPLLYIRRYQEGSPIS